MVYFAGWETDQKVFLAVLAGFVILAAHYVQGSERRPELDWRPAMWLWPYLGGLALLSYLGSFDGANIIPFPLDLMAVAVFSVAIFYLAQSLSLDAERVRKYIEHALEEEEDSEGSESPTH